MKLDDDSDIDPTKVKPTRAQWRLFEEKVAKTQAALDVQLDPNSVVEHDVRINGVLSGQQRQIDVLVTGNMGGQSLRIAVECKHYAKRLGIGAVDEFAGKLLDINVGPWGSLCIERPHATGEGSCGWLPLPENRAGRSTDYGRTRRAGPRSSLFGIRRLPQRQLPPGRHPLDMVGVIERSAPKGWLVRFVRSFCGRVPRVWRNQS